MKKIVVVDRIVVVEIVVKFIYMFPRLVQGMKGSDNNVIRA